MQSNKLLTVVVPTYNMEAYLSRCLSSFVIEDVLMKQIEVLVINDGSKDNSSEIAHTFENKYPNTFIVVDKENGNYGSCVNVGLKRATGKYFRILDADDWFDSEALTTFVNNLMSCFSDMIMTPFKWVTPKCVKIFSFSENIIQGKEYNMCELSSSDFLLHMHSMTYKTSLLKELQLSLSEGVSYTDTEYIFIPLRQVNTVTFFGLVLYQYLAERDGQTMSVSSMKKSTKSFWVVSIRLIDEYVLYANKLAPIVNELWIKLLKQITFFFYHTALTLAASSYEIKQQLLVMDSKISVIPEIEASVTELQELHIHYVRKWRKYGTFSSGPLCKVHYFVWNFINPIWLSFLKLFYPSRL